ncbi:MAG: transcription termination/antitermination factor NusG [Clostridiales bacterium]|nr:transcription termination/antitermination factor NusG [Clostridiales bacterium]
MSEAAKWYVIHTYSGYENKVADTIEKAVENRKLSNLIHAVKVPVEKVIEIVDNQEKEVERKLFPGYVLVKMIMTDDTWYIIRNIRGVTGFVGPGSKPVPLSDSEVESLGIEKTAVISLNYKVGDNVMITDGPLENFIGVVDLIETDKNLVRVLVSMFGRETPVELELRQVAPV